MFDVFVLTFQLCLCLVSADMDIEPPYTDDTYLCLQCEGDPLDSVVTNRDPLCPLWDPWNIPNATPNPLGMLDRTAK